MSQDVVSLKDAVSAAVEQGRAELNRLDDMVDELFGGFAKVLAGSRTESPLAGRLGEFARAIPRDLRRHLDRERDALGSFNIAFFGRTGVGKSTLLSAFGELDGEHVSPGASDWTTEVQHVEWRGCRLYDTPGINGWGRTESRENLEAEARRAVEIADVVLLCFDNQSQQAMEFEKVASWVRDHGKPVIAVLNVRNPRWRHPAKVPEARRRNLSEAVRQHTDNIRTELAQIGLPDTPIVAIHSRRALFARATTPFHGPAQKDFLHEREEFGTDYLTRWSNFGTLEQLIATSIDEGGADLRLSSLREDVRARCRRGVDDLEALAVEIEQAADVLEQQVAALFAVIGYPDEAERAKWLHDSGADLVDLSEQARGRPYTSSDKGTLDRTVRYLADSHLAVCGRQAHAKADALIRSAFDEGTVVGESEFGTAVFDEESVAAAVSSIWADRRAFLQRELDVAVDHADTHRTMAAVRTATILGSEGDSVIGKVVQGGGIAVGLGALAVPLLWNPAGWVLGAAAVASIGIGGQIQQYFGKRMSDEAEERARTARAQAIADSQHAVDHTFGEYTNALVRDSREDAWKLVGPGIAESLRTAVELRTTACRMATIVGVVRDAADSIGSVPAATDVLPRAQRRMADIRTDLIRILLGEDWLTDPEAGHRTRESDPAIQQMYDSRHENDRNRLRHAISAAWSAPSAAGIRSWREDLDDAALTNPRLLEVAGAFWRVDRARPAFTVMGDYNSGKSSLIRRILVENGQVSGTSLDIRALPATDVARRYEFPRFDLVDTPGLQSGRADHDTRAFDAVAGAALVFVVVHVNLLVGNTGLLEQIARGSDTIAAKGGRMVFLVNRCDELGVDPLTAPEAFLNLQDRKREELRAAFAGRSIEIDDDRIHCLSGDPFGLVGSDSAAGSHDFDEHRLWDGVTPLIDAIADLSDEQLTAATTAAAFDTAVTHLKRHEQDLRRQRDVAADELRRVEPMMEVLRVALDDAVILVDSLHEEVRRIVYASCSKAKSAAHTISRKDGKKLDELVGSWWKDPQLEAELKKYLADAATKVDEWYGEHNSAIGREGRAAQFQLSHDITEGFQAVDNAVLEDVAEGAGVVAGAAAPIVKALGTRDAVYAIGKQFGHKFKPWGAVKGGAKVAKVGVVLSAVAAAVDAGMMAHDVWKSSEYKDCQNAATQRIDEQAAELIESIARGEAGTGPLSYIEAKKSELDGVLAAYDNAASSITERIDFLSARVAVVENLLESADNLTGTHGRPA